MSFIISRYRQRGSYKVNPFLIQRNVDIKNEFRRLKDEGIKNRDAFLILANKFYLSEGTINSIIYARKS